MKMISAHTDVSDAIIHLDTTYYSTKKCLNGHVDRHSPLKLDRILSWQTVLHRVGLFPDPHTADHRLKPGSRVGVPGVAVVTLLQMPSHSLNGILQITSVVYLFCRQQYHQHILSTSTSMINRSVRLSSLHVIPQRLMCSGPGGRRPPGQR